MFETTLHMHARTQWCGRSMNTHFQQSIHKHTAAQLQPRCFVAGKRNSGKMWTRMNKDWADSTLHSKPHASHSTLQTAEALPVPALADVRQRKYEICACVHKMQTVHVWVICTRRFAVVHRQRTHHITVNVQTASEREKSTCAHPSSHPIPPCQNTAVVYNCLLLDTHIPSAASLLLFGWWWLIKTLMWVRTVCTELTGLGPGLFRRGAQSCHVDGIHTHQTATS